ncbi:response regulator [Marinomonas balearica]|uniref:Two-component system OmpR family response regulator/two-component system response regulator QseB n=1 Tax=Marinomonas balearica TaxID=491947 RepID=A0A4R6M6A1_9GAMM|nr:response regulator [Marinomonas balearica]TDO96863.1 two-component system OmpR family response regulator/two-component system response regulator QseB [Marinomonas balearica]
MRILVVEDDQSLGKGLCTALGQDGYTVDWLKDGVHANQAVQSEHFDLIILDIGLPRMDGFAILKNMRKHKSNIPVLILTARDAIEDRISGLDAGADDYLVKPFEVDELKARARALIRRSSGRASSHIEYKNIRIEPSAQQVFMDEQEVILTRREYSLLVELVSHPGHVFTRDVLQQLLYGWGDDVESNTLEVHIHHIRKKLFTELVRTVRGVGYIVDAE